MVSPYDTIPVFRGGQDVLVVFPATRYWHGSSFSLWQVSYILGGDVADAEVAFRINIQ